MSDGMNLTGPEVAIIGKAGRFLPVDAPADRTFAVSDLLRREVARAAGVPEAAVTAGRSLLGLGLDSLATVELQHGIEQALGVALPLDHLLDGIDLAGLERLVLAARAGRAVPRDGGADVLAAPAAAEGPAPDAIGGRAAELPLSPGQLTLWLVQQAAAHSGPLHIAAAARLLPQAGRRLDTAALGRALLALAARHPMLAASFAEAEGEPRQRPGAGQPPELVEVDATGWSEAALDAWCEAEAGRPFDLARGPLLRLAVARRGDTGDVVVFTIHHLVADFSSVAVLVRDLSALYLGEELPPLPLTWADHLRRQAELLAGPAAERLWDYWRGQLAMPAALPAPLALPEDFSPGTARSYRGGTVSLHLGRELSAGLAALAERSGATRFTVLLASFQALLGRVGGQDDLLVGSPAAGRNRPDLAGLAGYFVNLLPLRADLSGDPAFAAFLQRVRSRVSGALAHQELPARWLAERLGEGADAPLFRTGFALYQAPPGGTAGLAAFALGEGGGRLDFGGLTLESRALPERWSQLDLVLRVAVVEGELVASLQFAADRFEPVTAARLLGHWRELATGAAADPAPPLSALPWLTAAERHQLRVEWNDTARQAGGEPWIHEQVAAQARRRPEAPAVVDGGLQLSYGQLDRQARRLAGELRGLGVGPEVRVGVCLERSPELLIANLGVLHAGGAYVALDPSHPKERLSFQLADSGVPLLITRRGPLADLAAARGIRCLFPQAAGGEDAAAGPPPPLDPPALSPGNLAYVIYTSGSTGRPKGVDLSHGGLLNLVAWQRRALGIGEADRTTLLAAVGFDASVFETWVYLSAGAAMVLPPEALRTSPAELRDWIAEQGITANFLPTALAEAVFDLEWSGGAAACPAWRCVVAAGDRLHRRPPAALQCRVVNAYGPTETTVAATAGPVAPGGQDRPGKVPAIGRPLDNVQVYVADAGSGGPRQLPVGVAGELLVGGAGLARGYLRRPDLTAERFVPDPFAAAPGERLYRTGDLVRWSPAGEIEFLGRIDHQIKVRGQRIELGEIEAILALHPAVREAAALAVDGRLVAFVTDRTDGAPPPAAELREHARRYLPEAMLVTSILPLAELPLNRSGKVDRPALALLARQAMTGDGGEPGDAADTGGAGLSPVADVLAGIWSELLGVQRVHPDDDFFALGGHSLSVARLRSRVRAAFGLDLAPQAFFSTPTFAGQVAAIDAALRQADGAAGLPLAPAARDGDLRPSFAQQRLWFLDQLAPGTALYNVPMTAELRGALDVAVLGQSFAALVARHESLRTTFPETAAGAVQQIAPPSDTVAPPPPVADVSALPPAPRHRELERVLLDQAMLPFDLARGPLVRILLLRAEPERHVLLISLHHIITDGWSGGVVVRELSALYGSFARGEAPSLPALPIQYADYAVWQRQWLAGENLARQLDYWRAQLAGLEASELPTDRPRPAVETYRGTRRPAALTPSLTASLAALARGAGATLYMVLLAAFDALVASYTGRTDVVVGSPVANRSRRETEGVIGFFINTLVMRVSTAGDPTLRTLLDRVRATALAAYVHEDVPFEKVVEELQPQRDLSRNPLFQVMMAVQNVPQPALTLPGLEVSPRQLDLGLAKFDLTLVWEEIGGRLLGHVEYNTQLFDATTTERLLTHYRTLLERAVADPDQPIGSLVGPTAAERHQIVEEWNDTLSVFRPSRCVHEWIEEQAAATPDALALVAGETVLTYRELNGMANRLAHWLRRQGIGPDVLVGICVDRNWSMVVSLLGVLKAGGAALAIDLTYPEERQRYVIEDAGLALLIAEESLLPLLPDTGIPRWSIDAEWPRLDGESEADPEPWGSPDCAMYALYTSGSTGLPKGVIYPHRAFVNLLEWHFRESGLAPAARTVQFSTFGFCMSFFEICSVLCSGATLVMIPEEYRRDMEALWRYLEANAIERLHIPFSALKQLADVWGEEHRVPPHLREIVTTGEQLQIDRSLRGLFSQLKGCSLSNQYGASELHVVSHFRLPEPPADWPDISPVGRPIANNRVYLLDHQMQTLPSGVMGEVYAGGVCLARGYLGVPERTAQKFVPDPFAARRGVAGARLYRTGDLARFLPDGRIEWFGRADNQVKIRGFRVELGEVETAVKQHPLVRNAAVLARPGAGTPRLVAYVVPQPGQALPGDLRAFLKGKLPEQAVPVAFVEMAALPLNANGKLDQKELPDLAAGQGDEGFVPPAGPVEEVVAQIWCRILDLPEVGAHDDFFSLGGHSLLATQVVNRIRRNFAVELPLRALFEGPTVAELAQAVTALEARPGLAAKLARAFLAVRTMSQEEVGEQLRASRGGSAAEASPAAVPGPAGCPPAAPAEQVIDLQDDERSALCRLRDRMTLDPADDFERFAFESKLIFHQLPERLRRSLLEFGRRGNADGVLLVRGLAEDQVLPPTPVHSSEAVRKATFASELWLCVAAGAFGELIGYQQYKGGRIIQDVFPTPAEADKQSSESSSALLAFHTELTFHPFAPDYVLLLGLRPDPDQEARTMFAGVRRFFPLLSPADRDVLFEKAFRTGLDYSFGNLSTERGTGPLLSVFYGDRSDPFLRYDLDLMVGETPAACRALKAVRERIEEVKQDVKIAPGSLLVVDNRRSVHARSVFRAAFDGRDRWLQRAYVVRDLDLSAGDRLPGTRVIATDFSSYLGAAALPGPPVTAVTPQQARCT